MTTFINRFLRPLIDPSTLLIILGLVEFILYYPHRSLTIIAVVVAAIGVVAVYFKYWETAVPIQTFLLGTWIYNAVENNPNESLHLIEVMLFFLLLLSFGFWKIFHSPRPEKLGNLYSLYLSLATLIVWELAVLIDLFWPVEPWSRSFLVVAALVFLQMAAGFRLAGKKNPLILLGPLFIILLLTIIIIITTPISQI